MKVLGIIPARKGSRRIPGKNLREVGGRPLIEWVIEAALGAQMIDTLVVSSDDAEVLEVAERAEAGLALPRPAELAGHQSPAIDYVTHALESAETGLARFEATVILQPSSPFTPSQTIDEAISKLIATGADSVVTVVRVPHDLHPAKFKVLAGDVVRDYLEPEAHRMSVDDLPPIYVRNGSVYATARRTIDVGNVIGDDCRAIEMPRSVSIDINDEFDLLVADLMAARLKT